MELVAVVSTLKIWWHYLYGKECEVYIDYKSLKHLFTLKNLNMWQWRWLKTISVYQCEIKYHLGKTNSIADALSHKLKTRDKEKTSEVNFLLEGH